MTDVISLPGAGTGAQGDDPTPDAVIGDATAQNPLAAPPGAVPPVGDEHPLAWAPIEPAPKKRRLGLWIGLAAGVLAIGAGTASAVLIAPGTTVAGIPVGFMTPGAAADAISAHLAKTEVTLTGAGDGTVLTGAELGAELDAAALADTAFAERPLWNLGAWMGDPVPGTITLDPAASTAALRTAVPSSFDDATDAGVVFDAATGGYVTTPAVDGTGIDVAALNDAFIDAVAAGGTAFTFSGDPTAAKAAVSDEDAASMAEALNTMFATAGFYVGDERTVPVTAAVAAEWIDIVVRDGALQVVADEAAIAPTVDSLHYVVDRGPVNAVNITNTSGEVLRVEQEGITGRTLGDTSGVASDFAASVEELDGVYGLDVTEVPFETVALARHITIDLGEQRTYLYENGQVVNSWLVSTGTAENPTPAGDFTVFAHTRMQDMGCYEGAPYCTEDVPWITWFAKDIGFHGTYWHNNYGNRMSHGCVNLPIDLAKYVYDWSPVGLEVSVHY